MPYIRPDQFVVVSYLGLVSWAAMSDALEFEIPDAASLMIAALYPVHLLASPVAVDWKGALLVAVAIFVLGFICFVRRYWGGGDVKLLTAAALWAGPEFVLPLVLTMGLTGGLLAGVIWARHRLLRVRAAGGAPQGMLADAEPPRLPYGVAIATGAGLVGLRLLAG